MMSGVHFCAVDLAVSLSDEAEPMTAVQVRCGALGGTRTPNLLIRSQMLYPLSYERRF
jgi:hypothetical protein